MEREVAWQVEAARTEAEARGISSPDKVTSQVFFEGELQQVGGRAGLSLDGTTDEPTPEGQRINMYIVHGSSTGAGQGRFRNVTAAGRAKRAVKLTLIW